jgi:hypothetical protein
LADGNSVRIEAEQYLMAAGAQPWAPPINGLTQSGYLTSTRAMGLDRVGAEYSSVQVAGMMGDRVLPSWNRKDCAGTA